VSSVGSVNTKVLKIEIKNEVELENEKVEHYKPKHHQTIKIKQEMFTYNTNNYV